LAGRHYQAKLGNELKRSSREIAIEMKKFKWIGVNNEI
jgi:hypothetical protein